MVVGSFKILSVYDLGLAQVPIFSQFFLPEEPQVRQSKFCAALPRGLVARALPNLAKRLAGAPGINLDIGLILQYRYH